MSKTSIEQQQIESKPLDESRRFMPESLTPLFFTSIYSELTPNQRLRYNQLHACYFCEQIIFFEQKLGCPTLVELGEIAPTSALKKLINNFRIEENNHSAMFKQLLYLANPRIYGNTDFFFIKVHPILGKVFAWITHHPKLFPMLLWLQLLQEERAIHFSKCFLHNEDELEPQFTTAQRIHLSDEIRHVNWDHVLIDWLWPLTSRWLKIINANLFCWMLQEFFYMPKRGGVRVVEYLVREFPELKTVLPRIKQELAELSRNPTYLRSLYSRDIAPNCYRLLEGHQEFSSLATILPEFSHA